MSRGDPAAGEIWLADAGDEVRRPVFVISDRRFHRLAARAVIAPVVDLPDSSWPWHIPVHAGAVAVNQLGTLPIERLLDRIAPCRSAELRRARSALREITT